jgi:hypothetical protein
MFRPNWLPSSGAQVVRETATPLSHYYTLHFKGVKYLQIILKLFLKYYVMIILLNANVMGLMYILLVFWLFFGVLCSCF